MILESVGERCWWSCLPQGHEGPPGSASALFLAAHCLAYPASLLCSHTAPCPGLCRCPSTRPVSLILDCWLAWSPDAASLIDPATLYLVCRPTVMLPVPQPTTLLGLLPLCWPISPTLELVLFAPGGKEVHHSDWQLVHSPGWTGNPKAPVVTRACW